MMQIIDPLSMSLEQKKYRKQAILSSILDIFIFIFNLFFPFIFSPFLSLILIFNILAFASSISLFISTFYSQRLAIKLSQANNLIQFGLILSYLLKFILYLIG